MSGCRDGSAQQVVDHDIIEVELYRVLCLQLRDLVPGSCGSHVFLRRVEPGSGLGLADEIDDVVAMGRLDDLTIAGLAALVEAPVVELRDHLAGLEVLIQAAVVLGAGVLIVLQRKRLEVVLRGVGLPEGKDALGFRLGRCLRLIAVVAVAVLLALGLDEDVA